MPRVKGAFLYLAVASTQAAPALAPGIQAVPAGFTRVELEGDLKLRLNMLASTAGVTRNFRVWTGSYVRRSATDNSRQQCILQLIGTGTMTTGTNVGAAGQPVTQSDRMAHSFTWAYATELTTPKGPTFTRAYEFAEGQGYPYAPADNTVAELLVSGLGREDFLIVEFVGGTSTPANVIVTRAAA